MIFFIGPRVNESPCPDRLGPRPNHGTHHAGSGVDHPQAQNCRATYRPGQVCRRRLPLDRLDAANEPALTAAVRWDSGRRGQTAHPEGLAECLAQETAGRSSVGERDALAAGFCGAVGSCCAVRRTLRCDGKLLTPERRPNAVVILQEYYRKSARQACRGVGQHRSTQRHGGKAIALEEADLRRCLWHIAVNLIQRAAARPTASCGGKAGPRTTSGCNGYGVNKACSGLRRESESAHSPPKTQ